MGVYDRNVVYCPVCAVVAMLKQNAIGETNFPPHFKDGKCKYCNHEMLQIKETYEEIATPENPNWMRKEKPADEIKQWVIDHYITIPENTLYNPKAREKREYAERQESRRNYQVSRLTSTPKVPRCPRCNSTSIVTKEAFSTGKSIVGGLLAGTAGALIGGKGGNKMINVCQKCGHKWEPGAK